METLSQWLVPLAELGPWGGLVFVLAGCLALVAFVPASVVLGTCGFLWGPLWGFVAASAINLGGGALAFAFGQRMQDASWLISRVGERRMRKIQDAFRQRELSTAFLIRFSVLPHWAVNYSMGLSRLRWSTFALTSVAIVPSTWLMVVGGHVAGSVVQDGGDAMGWGRRALLIASGAATAVLMWVLARRARDILVDADGSGSDREPNDREVSSSDGDSACVDTVARCEGGSAAATIESMGR